MVGVLDHQKEEVFRPEVWGNANKKLSQNVVPEPELGKHAMRLGLATSMDMMAVAKRQTRTLTEEAKKRTKGKSD